MLLTTRQVYKVKSLRSSCPEASLKLKADLERLQGLQHPNIVHLLELKVDGKDVHMYFDDAFGESVESLIEEFGPFGGARLSRALYGVANGLQFLHGETPPVVHGDLRGANIIVDKTGVAKLIDFGCPAIRFEGGAISTRGSVPWTAPEAVQGVPKDGTKADIWSFGCTLIEMASGDKPWGAQTALDSIFLALFRCGDSSVPPIPQMLQGEGRDLTAWCLQPAQVARPTASELLGHSFFQL